MLTKLVVEQVVKQGVIFNFGTIILVSTNDYLNGLLWLFKFWISECKTKRIDLFKDFWCFFDLCFFSLEIWKHFVFNNIFLEAQIHVSIGIIIYLFLV
jgi:hypothetical protein